MKMSTSGLGLPKAVGVADDASLRAKVERAGNHSRESRQPRSAKAFELLGVAFTNVAGGEFLKDAFRALQQRNASVLVFIANAHTLTLTSDSSDFRDTLNRANYVLPDGIGVRLGARAWGARVRENLCGTDLIPRLLSRRTNRRYRCYLLGATPASIEEAARVAARIFPDWDFVGFHHGYFAEGETPQLLQTIHATAPDLLLVGMGNPLQEKWLVANRLELRVPLCIAVGGLFDFWSKRRRRAPLWMRELSLEWLHILVTEPHKWRRYVLGVWKFFYLIARERWLFMRGAVSYSRE